MSSVKKVIWFKKAKCAGTSFESYLEELGAIYYVHGATTIEELERPENRVICIREALFPYGKTLVKNGQGRYRLQGPPKIVYDLRRHLLVPFLPKQFMLSKFPDFLEKYPKFAVVRNPYDKFISSWKYLQSTKNRTIEQVLENLPKRRYLHDWIHIVQTQADCITSSNGEIIVDQIIYMERNFEDDVNEIIEYLDLPPRTLAVKNRSLRDDVQSYLSAELAKKIYERFYRDFRTFGYAENFMTLNPESPRQGKRICRTTF